MPQLCRDTTDRILSLHRARIHPADHWSVAQRLHFGDDRHSYGTYRHSPATCRAYIRWHGCRPPDERHRVSSTLSGELEVFPARNRGVLNVCQVYFLSDTSRTIGLLTDLYLTLSQCVNQTQCLAQHVRTDLM